MNKTNTPIVLSIEDLAETDEFVIVKITEAICNEIKISYEKAIKDEEGDIIKFERI